MNCVRGVSGGALFKREKLKIFESADDAIAGIPSGSKLLVGGPLCLCLFLSVVMASPICVYS